MFIHGGKTGRGLLKKLNQWRAFLQNTNQWRALLQIMSKIEWYDDIFCSCSAQIQIQWISIQKSRIISADEDPSLRIESFAIRNSRGVSMYN